MWPLYGGGRYREVRVKYDTRFLGLQHSQLKKKLIVPDKYLIHSKYINKIETIQEQRSETRGKEQNSLPFCHFREVSFDS